MNDFARASILTPDLAPGRFAVGQPVSRKEDPVLLRGEGRYTDDLNLPGQLHGVVVRSRIAHGVLKSVDVEGARAMPGVHAVLLAADIQALGFKPMPVNVIGQNFDGRPFPKPAQWPLATTKVRYVGDPIAFVVAETRDQAKDAAEAIFADIDPLPAVTEPAEAETALALYDEAPDNVVLDWKFGDPAAVDEAFARAAHITTLRPRNSRVVVCAMEPRSAIAEIEGERTILRLGTQGVFGLRGRIAATLGCPPGQVRVLAGNTGGSFGMKSSAYAEYFCAIAAARITGRPVKWTDERSDSFLSDSHGRDHDHTIQLAMDKDGHFLALRVRGWGNIGASLANSSTLPPTMSIVKNIIGVYRTPAIDVAVKCVFTNTAPVGPYRGAGRPEANYYMERMVDTAAREMGIDRVELRRRNHVGTDMIPYQAPSTMHYDSGDFRAVLDDALEAADYAGFPARRAASNASGKLRGVGIGQYLEATSVPNGEMGGIRFEPDGSVTIITGTLDHGQGHATPFAQVLVDALGVPFERINLLQGDSDQLLAGGGTGGSRSIMCSGEAIRAASLEVIEKGRHAAAHLLEAAPADIEFGRGRFTIAGTDRGIDIMDLAAKLRASPALPDGTPASIDASLVIPGIPSAYPNGCHICEIEVDPETGIAEVVRYTMVNDFGVLVNPLMVQGQTHGGVVQGIGQVLGERVVFDEDGQLLTGSYMDYALPRADQVPWMEFRSHPVPARTNGLGAKGCGEAGTSGALPAVMNALVDALAQRGITHIDMPATPEIIWKALQDAGT